MKAAVFYETGGPHVLRYEDVADPACAPDGVVLRVEAISIEGGDVLSRASARPLSVPHIVGYSCAGTIVDVGDDVRDRSIGQRVTAFMWAGSHAELAATDARFTWPLPEGMDVIDAACVPVSFGTSHDCLFEFGRLVPAETVLVQAGASGVGIAAIQLAKRAGATVIATASSEDRLAPLAELGMDVGVDYSRDDWVDAVRDASDGRGPDLIVDCVGGHVLRGSLACLAYRGRCVYVGGAGREASTIDVTSLLLNNQALLGVLLGVEMSTDRVHRMITTLLEDVATGGLRVVVDSTFALADAADAHAHIEGRDAIGRVILIP